MVFKVLCAFCIGFSALVAGQKYYQSWLTARVAELPSSEAFPASASVPGMAIDPNALRRAINPPIGALPYGPSRR